MKVTVIASIVLLSTVFPAAAHAPWFPNLTCTPNQAVHDWVSANIVTATAMEQTLSGGLSAVMEPSLDCPLIPLVCADDIVVDGGGTPEDPSDDIVIPCDPPLDTPLVPGTDGDFDWGVGGALLPDGHHTGDDGIVTVTCAQEELDLPPLFPKCSWIGGRDGDGSGFIDGGDDPTDCLSSPISGSSPAGGTLLTDLTDGRTCDAAGAAGPKDADTWIYIATHVNLGDDGSFANNCGPIVAIVVDPNGDGDPSDSTVTINPLWIPGPPGPTGCLTITPPTPGSIQPEVSVSIAGHAG